MVELRNSSTAKQCTGENSKKHSRKEHQKNIQNIRIEKVNTHKEVIAKTFLDSSATGETTKVRETSSSEKHRQN